MSAADAAGWLSVLIFIAWVAWMESTRPRSVFVAARRPAGPAKTL